MIVPILVVLLWPFLPFFKLTDRGDASDNESSKNSLLDWLTTFGQTENVTSEQKENQSWREESEISANSDELRFGLESNLEYDDENSNPENEYVASAELPRREDTEDSQRQVENPQFESLFTTASASEHDTMETLMEVPPTRSQRRLIFFLFTCHIFSLSESGKPV